MNKQCSRCKTIKPMIFFGRHNVTKDGFDTYCRDCRNIKSAEYRNKVKDRNKERYYKYYKNCNDIEKIKIKSRQKAMRLLKKGYIKKQNCFLCDDRDSEMHHIDYNYPEKIIWLCKEHHYNVHTIFMK